MSKKSSARAEKEVTRAIVVGVPFYEEHDAVVKAAAARRMKKGPFIREVVRKFMGQKSQLDGENEPKVVSEKMVGLAKKIMDDEYGADGDDAEDLAALVLADLSE